MTGIADDKLGQQARDTNKICISEMLSAVATLYAFRRQLIGRTLLIFVVYEAACATLPRGTANEDLSLVST